MLLKLEDPKFFANLVSIISELVTEVRIKVNKNGMSLTAVDPATVAMVYFNIPPELFSQFEIENEVVLGVNLNDLKSILRRCGMGGSLIIEKDENMLKIGIRDRIKRDFKLALIDIEGEEKEMPEWEFKSVIKMDSQAFVDAVEDCLVVSDACSFIAEPSKFIIEAKGLHSSRVEFSSDEAEIYSDMSIARFSLEYLSKFIKGAKISNKVEINFSENHPMRINFPTGKVMLSFILAPRVEQDD
ncbi:proliferating cell nuclear antigen (pcna) [Candidatus Pacearchaeota archaeon CG10_big_fil_rev_8_21_14_0_10_34_76]|nr:MAG: proliferating cell nuclear antigen (pcna) [Candidatus Pacearchaeota archaeon CG10_big_fil_rev_8_21_14_0_10_34_76]